MTTLFAIYDTMQYIKPDVSTIVMGQAASAAAVLALSGAKGKRYTLPHARILLHQPFGGAEGQAVDIEIQAKEIVRNREQMNGIIATHTGQPLERVSTDTDRDFILTAEQAVEYGAVDEIITSRGITPALAAAAAGGFEEELSESEPALEELPKPQEISLSGGRALRPQASTLVLPPATCS
jgi:ATP-dependent Clp protease protease subunit